MAGTLDLSEIVKQASLQSLAEADELARISKTQEELGSSVGRETSAITREAELAGAKVIAENAEALVKQQRNQDSAAFFGVNQEASNSLIQSFSEQIIADHHKLVASGEQIKARQQKSFLDDPLGWIADQFALPSDVAAHNTGVANMQLKVDTLKKLGELADAQVSRNNAINSASSAARAKLEAERLALVATRAVENARQEAMKLGVHIGSVRLATTGQQWQRAMALHRAEVDLQQLALQKVSNATNEKMKELQMQQLQLLLDKRKTDMESDRRIQAQLDQATAVLGMRRLTVDEYEKAPAEQKRALWDVMSDPNTNYGRLGADTVMSLRRADALNAPLTPELQKLRGQLNRWTTEMTDPTKNPIVATMKPEQLHAHVQKGLRDKIAGEAGNIPDGHGLYSAPPLGAMAGIPAVANTILWKSSFEPLAKVKPATPTSAQQFYDNAINLVSEKKMDMERAVNELAIIFSSVAADNSNTRQYNRFALPMQNSYSTTIRTGAGVFGNGSQIVDMSNPTAVRNAMLRTLAANRLDPISGSATPNNGLSLPNLSMPNLSAADLPTLPFTPGAISGPPGIPNPLLEGQEYETNSSDGRPLPTRRY